MRGGGGGGGCTLDTSAGSEPNEVDRKDRKEIFYLTTLLSHFIYGYMEGRKCFI